MIGDTDDPPDWVYGPEYNGPPGPLPDPGPFWLGICLAIAMLALVIALASRGMHP
jgi:hypothetical protein